MLLGLAFATLLLGFSERQRVAAARVINPRKRKPEKKFPVRLFRAPTISGAK